MVNEPVREALRCSVDQVPGWLKTSQPVHSGRKPVHGVNASLATRQNRDAFD